MIITETIPNNTIGVKIENVSSYNIDIRYMEDKLKETACFQSSMLNPSYSLFGNNTTCFVIPEEKIKEDSFYKGNFHCIVQNSSFTTKFIEINSIKSKILSLQKEGNVENTLDYIFNTLDDLIIENKLNYIDYLFQIINIKELNIDSIVGILTITSICKNELISRRIFYQQAYELINEMYLKVETNQILYGLE